MAHGVPLDGVHMQAGNGISRCYRIESGYLQRHVPQLHVSSVVCNQSYQPNGWTRTALPSKRLRAGCNQRLSEMLEPTSRGGRV